MNANRAQVITSAAAHALSVIYPSSLWAKSDGLISYGPDTPDLFYRAASYVDRILKGEKLADLPVQVPDEVRVGRQPQDRHGAQPDDSANRAGER